MKIKKIIWRNRRDFTAIMECQFCKHEETNKSGYDDRYYHDTVIPNMKCDSCDKSTISEGEKIENTVTKYPDHYNI